MASDVIPFIELVDLKGHLSSMKLVSKELDSILQSWVEEHIGRLNSEGSVGKITQFPIFQIYERSMNK